MSPAHFSRQFRAASLEDGLPAREEVEDVEVVRQVDEIHGRPRLGVDCSRLPDLEAMEGAEDDVARRRRARRSRVLPVREGLRPVCREPRDLARPLHLDDAHAGPEEIHEAAGRSVLEASARGLPVDAVAVEKLVEERLRLGSLGALVAAPTCRELGEAAPDLVLGRPHDRARASAVPSGPRRRSPGEGDGRCRSTRPARAPSLRPGVARRRACAALPQRARRAIVPLRCRASRRRSARNAARPGPASSSLRTQ